MRQSRAFAGRWTAFVGRVRYAKLPERPMQIDRLDHLVLTVADVGAPASCTHGSMGIEVCVSKGRTALIRPTKINLHPADGSWSGRRPPPPDRRSLFHHLDAAHRGHDTRPQCDVPIVAGPAARRAIGTIQSVSFTIPIESGRISNYRCPVATSDRSPAPPARRSTRLTPPAAGARRGLDHRCTLFGDHDRRSVGVGRGHRRHHRRIDDP